MIEPTNSGIFHQLRDYAPRAGAAGTYKWKVHNQNIEIISFVV